MPTEQRDMLLLVIKIGALATAVDLFGLVVMAWQHQGETIGGLVLGLLLVLGSVGFACYRLGQGAIEPGQE